MGDSALEFRTLQAQFRVTKVSLGCFLGKVGNLFGCPHVPYPQDSWQDLARLRYLNLVAKVRQGYYINTGSNIKVM